MKCPHCHTIDSKVIESREAGEGDAIRRRRECQKCGHRYTTYERIERPNLAVVKKDGTRELFDRQKLFAAIHRSVGKFFASEVEVEDIASKVEEQLYDQGSSEVTSKQIGDLVMEELAKRNEVAYIRFASVYREFTSIAEYEAAIKKLRVPKD
ncbi:MAG TPA: transcriptional regulator NrdR [Candidatus Saccharimonadales bacterium]|jgi:transcriptional repressor NrdR|nr:transcriptional regulator NrdR [Candidatus Saccharimonadales bacterium]